MNKSIISEKIISQIIWRYISVKYLKVNSSMNTNQNITEDIKNKIRERGDASYYIHHHVSFHLPPSINTST